MTASTGSPVTADTLLTAEQVAARWQLPGRTPEKAPLRMAREGLFPDGVVVKLGRYVRFKLDGIEKVEQEGGVDA